MWPFTRRARKLPPPTAREVGDSGTSRAFGTIAGYEDNPLLADPARRSRQLRDMLYTDPKLAGAVDLLFQTLLSATWAWEAPEHSGPNAKRNADWLNQAFGLAGHPGRMAEPWETQVERMLGFITFGWQTLEPVYYYSDGAWWLKGLYDMEPESFCRWTWDDNGDLSGMVQRTEWPTWSEAIIPAEKMLLIVLHQTGQNLHGRAILRPCRGFYNLKLHTMKQLGVGLDRWAVPMPLVDSDWTSARDAGMTRPEYEAELAIVQTVAQRIQSREAAYATQSKFVGLNVLGEGVFDPKPAVDVIALCDQQNLTALMMHFLELGLGSVGSRSVGMIHENAFRRAAINLNDKIGNAVGGLERPGGGIGARMLRWQFYAPSATPAEDMPVLRHKGLKIEALAEALSQLPGLTQAEIVQPGQLAPAVSALFGLEPPTPAPAQPAAVAPPAGTLASPGPEAPTPNKPAGRPPAGSTIR